MAELRGQLESGERTQTQGRDRIHDLQREGRAMSGAIENSDGAFDHFVRQREAFGELLGPPSCCSRRCAHARRTPLCPGPSTPSTRAA